MVAGGDRLGKTIVFAKNRQHAAFIAERFDANYPHLKGEFARVVTFETEYVQTLIDAFSNKARAPHIAISVDMLDTGIDVPEVVNLVFFKLVRSKTKFWQMLGRGTRLCPDLFGPGENKKFFYVFDYCQNLEYFSQDVPVTEGSAVASLAKRLFDARLELLATIDQQPQHQMPTAVRETQPVYGDPATDAQVRQVVAEMLQREVAAMNLDNFVVRPHRRLVEKYAKPEAWLSVAREAMTDLSRNVAGLPTELDSESEEAKRFDLLVLNLQLALLRSEPGFARLRDRVKAIAGLLSEKSSIPMVQAQMPLILDILTDVWWQDVTTAMLETVRRRLRSLVQLIDKQQRKIVYTDFVDEMGPETAFALPGTSVGTDSDKFRAKARAFLRQHLDHVTIAKLRMNRALTPSDLVELERLLATSGVAEPDDIRRAAGESKGLGVFVRSLVGLDRAAAKDAMARFVNGRTLSANQLEFINLIVDHLTEHGVMAPERLYESPFTDLTPRGPDGLFPPADVDALLAALEAVRSTAVAA
jgi:type I restriction enzyme R subunit